MLTPSPIQLPLPVPVQRPWVARLTDFCDRLRVMLVGEPSPLTESPGWFVRAGSRVPVGDGRRLWSLSGSWPTLC